MKMILKIDLYADHPKAPLAEIEQCDFSAIDQIDIGKHGKIINPKLFFDSHISLLKAQSGNPRYYMYYQRLNAAYQTFKKFN